MSDTNFAYPFDPTGTAQTNKITGESKPISPPDWSDFYFIVPSATPFFRESLVLHHHPSGRRLHEGVDYICTHRFHDASLACGKPIFGSITFYDRTLSGVIDLSYQTVGGAWTIDEEKIIDLLSNALQDPRVTTWEQVIELPMRFPVIDHEWDLDDMVGMTEVVDAIAGIEAAIRASDGSGFQQHVQNYSNPHQVNKDQVGLGSVENYPVANTLQATSGTSNSHYMTPLRTMQAVDMAAVIPLTAHRDNRSNPHDVTKAQVGLGSVENLPMATEAQALSGEDHAAYMSPLRTRQAIQAIASSDLNVHTTNLNNPHAVTKAQVGLGSVENLPLASVEEARSGTSHAFYMTPLMVREAIMSSAAGDITIHVNDANNPHNTTKTHVGLGNVQNYGVATTAQAQSGTANDVYMTPLRTREAIQTLVVGGIDEHVNNVENPHFTTKAQVGLGNVQNYDVATETQAVEGTSNTTYMTPLRVAQVMATLDMSGLDAHIDDKTNPHEVTKDQIDLGNVDNYATATVAQTTEGLSETLFVTPAGVRAALATIDTGGVQEHVEDHDNPHEVTAAQVGAYSTTEVDQLLGAKLDMNGTAANADRIGGYTFDELVAANRNTFQYPRVRRTTTMVDDVEVVSNADVTWTQIGTRALVLESVNGLSPVFVQQDNIVFMLAGGESSQRSGETSVFSVEVSPDRPSQSRYQRLSGMSNDPLLLQRIVREALDFGEDEPNDPDPQHPSNYRHTYELWVQGPIERNMIEINTTRFDDQGSTFFLLSSPALDEMPLALMPMQRAADAVVEATTAGTDIDIANVSKNAEVPFVEYSEQLVSFSEVTSSWSVATRPADSDQWADETERSSVWMDMGSDSPDSVQLQVTSDLTLGDDVVLYRSHNPIRDFAMELEFSQVVPSMNRDVMEFVGTERGVAVGLCLAHVEQGGKSHGLYVYRTDGGIDGHGLLSFGYNLFQPDEEILQTTSVDLRWGDGELDPARDPATYTGLTYATANMGIDPIHVDQIEGLPMSSKMHIRVSREGDTFTIEVADYGADGDYTSGPAITFDLSDRPDLKTIFDGPVDRGLVARNLANVIATGVNYPNRYQTHYSAIMANGFGVISEGYSIARVEYSGLPSAPSVTTGDAAINHAEMATDYGRNYAGLRSFNNRLVYSPVDGKLYLGQRNGKLRYLLIDADTIDNETVITP